MSNDFVVEMLKYGESLGPRVLGSSICDEVLEHWRKGEHIVIDFSGVRSISSGFSFELFSRLKGELKDEFKNAVTIKISNAISPELVKSIVSRALATPYRPGENEMA